MPSLKGLINFSPVTQGLRPGLILFRPCGALILRNRSTVATQNELSHMPRKARTTQGTTTIELR